MGAASGYNTARTSPKLVEKMAMVSPSLGAANWRSSLMNWSGRGGLFLLPLLQAQHGGQRQGQAGGTFHGMDPPFKNLDKAIIPQYFLR